MQKDFIESSCASPRSRSSLPPALAVNSSHPGDQANGRQDGVGGEDVGYARRCLSIARVGAGYRESTLRPAAFATRGDGKGTDAAGEKTMIEARTLAMLADAAISAEDFEVAMGFAQRLVDKVAILRTRSSSSTSSSSKMLEQALELGWKTCFQLSKHPLWKILHLESRCLPTL